MSEHSVDDVCVGVFTVFDLYEDETGIGVVPIRVPDADVHVVPDLLRGPGADVGIVLGEIGEQEACGHGDHRHERNDPVPCQNLVGFHVHRMVGCG